MKRWKGYQKNGNEAKDQLGQAGCHLFWQGYWLHPQSLPQNADKVKQEILQKISELSASPEIHPADKYKQDNDGSYRCFELHRYRVSYLVKEQEIIITRVRHTSQEPQQY